MDIVKRKKKTVAKKVARHGGGNRSGRLRQPDTMAKGQLSLHQLKTAIKALKKRDLEDLAVYIDQMLEIKK